jgi:hypothetical protein
MTRRFGYYIVHDHKKMDIGRDSQPLSEDAWNDFNKYVAVATDVRPFVIDYLSLQDDFEVVSGVITRITSEVSQRENPLANIGINHLKTMATAQGAISNFLSSASAFRDRAKTRLRTAYGKASAEEQRFIDTERAAYDGWFAYRLLYNLRNYGQHHDMPLSLVPVSARREADGKFAATANLLIDPTEILESDLIQNSFRKKELSKLTEQLELMPMVQQYMRLHGLMLNLIVSIHLPRLVQMQEYEALLHEKTHIPLGAIPMIYEESEKGEIGRFHHFSFDEVLFLRELAGSIQKPEPDPFVNK